MFLANLCGFCSDLKNFLAVAIFFGYTVHILVLHVLAGEAKNLEEVMKVGILGAGGIAVKMANTVSQMDGIENYAVASRSLEKARDFADKYGVAKAYGSYEEMLADPDVDLVYVATPHSHHCEWTIKSLEAGHHVLCEKAFAANYAQAEKMIECARSKKLLLAEAIWTRYMPSRKMIDDLIRSGEIGELVCVDSNLGYRIDQNQRLIDPALAGGSLLDLTVYCLNFSSMVMGDDIRRIDAKMIPTPSGVDGKNTVMLSYKNGAMASMFSTLYALTDRRGLITGRDGFIEVENINNPQRITVYDASGKEKKTLVPPPQISGYEYELASCQKAIAEGKIECPEMPHAETLEIMQQMDEIRAQFGIRFPFE